MDSLHLLKTSMETLRNTVYIHIVISCTPSLPMYDTIELFTRDRDDSYLATSGIKIKVINLAVVHGSFQSCIGCSQL
jgi:hypothetical protein